MNVIVWISRSIWHGILWLIGKNPEFESDANTPENSYNAYQHSLAIKARRRLNVMMWTSVLLLAAVAYLVFSGTASRWLMNFVPTTQYTKTDCGNLSFGSTIYSKEVTAYGSLGCSEGEYAGFQFNLEDGSEHQFWLTFGQDTLLYAYQNDRLLKTVCLIDTENVNTYFCKVDGIDVNVFVREIPGQETTGSQTNKEVHKDDWGIGRLGTVQCGEWSYTAFQKSSEGGIPASSTHCQGEYAWFEWDTTTVFAGIKDGQIDVAQNGYGTLTCTETWRHAYDCGPEIYLTIGKTEQVVTGPMQIAFRDTLIHIDVAVNADLPNWISQSTDLEVCRGYQFVTGDISTKFNNGVVKAFVSGNYAGVQVEGSSSAVVLSVGEKATITLNEHETLNYFFCRPRSDTNKLVLDFLWHYQP